MGENRENPVKSAVIGYFAKCATPVTVAAGQSLLIANPG